MKFPVEQYCISIRRMEILLNSLVITVERMSKRGLRMMDKRGITTLMMILEIIIVLVAAYSIFSIASRFVNSETTNKIIIADDLKMMIDTLVGTPGEAVVKYPANVSKYTFVLSSGSVSVFIKSEGEQKKIVRYFSLPDGYQAFGTLEGKDSLCLEKEQKKIVLRECIKTATVAAEETVTKSSPEAATGPTFYGIPVTDDRIVFVLDRSASMEVPSEWEFGASGEEVKSRLDVEKSQFEEVLKNLPDGKYFTVIMFNNEDNDELISKVVELNSNNVKINTIGTFTLVGGEGTSIYENEEKGKKLLQALAEQSGGVYVMQEK